MRGLIAVSNALERFVVWIGQTPYVDVAATAEIWRHGASAKKPKRKR